MKSNGDLLIDLCLGLTDAEVMVGADVDALSRAALALKVDYQLLNRLDASDAAGLAGRGLAYNLERHVRETGIKNFYVDRSLEEVWDRFADVGIESIQLKGHAFRLTRRGSEGRSQLDTDVLVRRSDVARAESVLIECGFRVAFASNRRRWLSDRHFHFYYTRGPIVFELHWDLDNPSPDGFIDRFWDRSRSVEARGRRWRVPAPEHALLFACTHLSRHRFARGLRWLSELALDLPLPADVWHGFRREAALWPSRIPYSPLWLLERLGVSGSPAIGDDAIQARTLDSTLLRRLLRRRLVGETWAGLPPWQIDRAVGRWLESRRTSAGCLLSSLTDSVRRRSRRQPARTN